MPIGFAYWFGRAVEGEGTESPLGWEMPAATHTNRLHKRRLKVPLGFAQVVVGAAGRLGGDTYPAADVAQMHPSTICSLGS
jgi:hypothetical protein